MPKEDYIADEVSPVRKRGDSIKSTLNKNPRTKDLRLFRCELSKVA